MKHFQRQLRSGGWRLHRPAHRRRQLELRDDFVSGIEKRNEYTYICNHEWGLYAGRLIGCGLFILIAKFISEDAALKITLPLVTILQGVSYFVARNLLTRMEKKEKESICDKTMCNVVVV